MPELILLRHAQAIRYNYDDDFNRVLRKKGKRNAQRVGTWLAQHKLLPDRVYSSPALRCLTTAEKVCKSAGQGIKQIRCVDQLYPGSLASITDLLKQIPDKCQRVMLVGHNPVLEKVLGLYCRDKLKANKKSRLLSPASLAVLQIPVRWRDLSADCGRLLYHQHADDLPATFPYPLYNPKEQRIRPAYYYQQSAVIPYRYDQNKLKIMLITSSTGNHWVIPKGIVEPDMTPQASAAKEAYEEAAIEGWVHEKRVGTYRAIKWQAISHVKVYAMQLKQQLGKKSWQEKYRKRIWVPVNRAEKMLDNPELKKLVRNLPGWLEQNR